MHGEGREEKVCDVFGSLSGGLGSTYSKESGAMSRKKNYNKKKKLDFHNMWNCFNKSGLHKYLSLLRLQHLKAT